MIFPLSLEEIKNESNMSHAQMLRNEPYSYMELYEGYDPRYRSTSDGFLFSAHVYTSDVDPNLIVIFWDIEKKFVVMEKLSSENFNKLTEEK